MGLRAWSPQRQKLWSIGEPPTQSSCRATIKMHFLHPHLYIKIAPVLYPRQFACCETTVINQKTIVAAILEFALPNVCSSIVTFQFTFSGFPLFTRTVQSYFITSAGFRLCNFSLNPKDFSREKSLSCQIAFQAKAQRCTLPLTWQGVFYVNCGFWEVTYDLHYLSWKPAIALKNDAGSRIFSTDPCILLHIKHTIGI